MSISSLLPRHGPRMFRPLNPEKFKHAAGSTLSRRVLHQSREGRWTGGGASLVGRQ